MTDTPTPDEFLAEFGNLTPRCDWNGLTGSGCKMPAEFVAEFVGHDGHEQPAEPRILLLCFPHTMEIRRHRDHVTTFSCGHQATLSDTIRVRGPLADVPL